MTANTDQIEYWNKKAGPTWVEQMDRLDAQLRPLGELAIDRLAPAAGSRVLDVGCGCGDHTLALARRVGPDGVVLGVDISEPMLARARSRSEGVANVTYVLADAQTHAFVPESFHAISSRFGVMFFADFAAAFTNLRTALRPGGRLAFVAWQPIDRNPWMLLPMQVASRLLELPPPGPPGSPGPFGLDDPARIRGALDAAGFTAVAIEDVREPQNVGGAKTLDDAVAFLLVAGPAAAALRGSAPELRTRVADALRAALSPYVTDRGVFLPGAAWIVTAVRPGR